MGKKTLILIQLLSLLACADVYAKGSSAGKDKLPAEAFKKYQACDHDTDCVRANNGCCDCANGGEMIAVHRKHEKAVRALFVCKDVMCTQRAGDCMHWLPVCAKGFCAVVPPKTN